MPQERPPFVHLHVHSHYSLLDGLSKLEGLIERAKEYGMPALGLTDHGNMYGSLNFYKACKKAEIKPIIGVETYIAQRTRFDKTAGLDGKRYHLTLLAKNNTGYKNLLKLVTLANLEGYYYKPRMDKDLLREYGEGLICMSGCLAGELSRMLTDGNKERATEIAYEYQEIFGKENYYMELMHHPGVPRQEEVNAEIIKISRETGIPVVATYDSHYLYPEDSRAHQTLLAVQTGKNLGEGQLFADGEDFSFISSEKAYELYDYIPEAVENTFKIAEQCDIEIELGNWVFPNLEIEEGLTYDDALRKWAYEGFEKRGLEQSEERVTRLDYELDVIKTKGYSVYFLIVGDLIKFARDNGILTNIRGSVAGSLTTYLVGITNVDPIEYKIPFERFLNPLRPSAPDIDMDFADNRRDEVLQYAIRKYGKDKVAHIGTFGTMMAKGAVRDVARALGYPYAKGDAISALIPMGSQGFPMTIERAMDMEPGLTAMYKKDPETKEIIDLAKKLEGCVRHVSVHAAGVVISPKPLTEYVPTQLDPRGGRIITQYDMHGVEDAGLIKFDFLGIRNLSILGNAIEIVEATQQIQVDIDTIPIDDTKTYEMLAKGETMGLFQLNGSGMTKWLMELRPTKIEDINAMVALYRPGPMEQIPEYIKRKRDPSLITYMDPRLKEVLEASYGLIVYQDDVLMIAINIAGYDWMEADKLRKAMGKKIPEEMQIQKEKFLKGAVDHGKLSPQKAQALWDFIEPFASYGFNKAHAASYGLVAYWTAYMKANYPGEYMTAVLSAEANDTDKVMDVIAECKRMGIDVLAPDVNESFANFAVIKAKKEDEKDKIRFGLLAIKNIGEHIAKEVVRERKERGPYKSLEDLLTRIQDKDLNKKSLESFIRSGAFDTFGERNQMLYNIEAILAFNKKVAAEHNSRQASLFGDAHTEMISLRLEHAPEIEEKQKLAWEKELLGLYISSHPLESINDLLSKFVTSCKNAKAQPDGKKVRISGIIANSKKIFTKKNEPMLFVTIEDLSDTIEGIVFPSMLKESSDMWEHDTIIAVEGKISRKNNEIKLICETVKEVNDGLLQRIKQNVRVNTGV